MNDVKDKDRGLPPEGLSLIVGPDDGIIDNADVRVRWCITPRLTAYFKQRELENPHILLCAYTPDGRNEWRGIFPINEIIAFARFYNAGDMNLAAFIVDVRDDYPYDKKMWLVKDYGSYEIQTQYKGRITKSIRDDSNILASTHTTLRIPKNVFAKEPPKWLDWFANLWHGKNKYDDGCEFRRRALIAFGIKWIPMAVWTMLIWTLMTILGALLYGAGLKTWVNKWSYLKNPFNGTAVGSFIDNDYGKYGNLADSTFSLKYKWHQEVTQPIFSLLWLTPSVVLSVFVIAFWFGIHNNLTVLLAYFQAHTFTAWFVGICFSVHVLYEICIAIGNAIKVFWSKELFDRTIAKQYQDGGLVAITTMVIILLFAQPWWVSITIFSIIAILFLGFAARQYNLAATTYGKYVAFFEWVGNYLDMWFGAPESYDNIQEMLCPDDIDNLSTDIHSLPTKNVSWYLRYRDTKAKMCKPRQRK